MILSYVSVLILFISNIFIVFSSDASSLFTQIHLALAGKDKITGLANTMAVSWSTTNSTDKSVVKYGEKSGSLDLEMEGYEVIYYETAHHHVVLEASTLKPSTKYYYKVGDGTLFSEEFYFTSPVATSDPNDQFSFAVFADLGLHKGDDTQNYLLKLRENKEIDLVWHGGDIGYADDSFTHLKCVFKFCYEETYDSYMELTSKWASYMPYMVTPGNHEAECHSPACLTSSEKREKLSNFTAYNNRFRMPGEECNAHALNMHYSYNYKNVHFISIDSETGYDDAPLGKRYVLPCGGFTDQLSWFEEDLIQANKERHLRPWIFVIAHRPIYQGDGVTNNLQDAIEKLLKKYKVDIYFAGHVHSYERTFPVFHDRVPDKNEATAYDDPEDTTHLMLGGPGNDEMRGVFKSPERLEREALKEKYDVSPSKLYKDNDGTGPWTAFQDTKNFGIGKVDILSKDELRFSYIRTGNGEVHDQIVLKRTHN